jgi:ribosomal protein L11 methyltransferase
MEDPGKTSIPTLQNASTPCFGSGWLEISVQIHPVAHEALSAFLFDLGCEGLVSENLQGFTLKGYLPFQKDLEKVKGRIQVFLRELESIFDEVEAPKLSFQEIQDQDWSCTWRQFFRALKVTPNLTILPAWEAVPSIGRGHIIRMDPGPAFGTGQHATTQMCLRAIGRFPKPKLWSMLDVGTGSGILAIYGAKLGSKRILALDTDPEALAWAKRNIALNELSNSIHLSSLPLRDIEEQFTIAVANLIFNEILELMPLFCKLVEPGGCLILSGILREQVDVVKGLLALHAFENMDVRLQDEWACLRARK